MTSSIDKLIRDYHTKNNGETSLSTEVLLKTMIVHHQFLQDQFSKLNKFAELLEDLGEIEDYLDENGWLDVQTIIDSYHILMTEHEAALDVIEDNELEDEFIDLHIQYIEEIEKDIEEEIAEEIRELKTEKQIRDIQSDLKISDFFE